MHRYFFHLCRSHHHRKLLYRLPDRWYHCFLPEFHQECTLPLPLPRHLHHQDLLPSDCSLSLFLVPLLRQFPILFLPFSLSQKMFLSLNPSLLQMPHPQIPPADIPSHHPRAHRSYHQKSRLLLPALCIQILLPYRYHLNNLQNAHLQIQ